MRLPDSFKRFFAWRDQLPAPVAVGLRAAFLALAPLLAFFLVEGAWRESFDDFQWAFLLPNVFLYALVLAVFYLLGQRSRVSIALYLAVFLVVGIAFHFVFEFKGQPILPADVLAAGTALSVGAGYSYQMDERLWATVTAFALYCIALFVLVPRRRMTLKGHGVCTALGVVALAATGAFFVNFDLDEGFDFRIENWMPGYSFAQYGTFLGFASLAQDVSVPVPAGYSADRAREILADAQERAVQAGETEALKEEAPVVIVVMNETFSDLSSLAGDNAAAFELPECRRIMAQSQEAGTALVSVLGGGTCNSEFEFLTGCSMALQGGGYYPYMYQEFSNAQTLPRYLASLGYETTAIHPNLASNWQRDRIYPEMGFDRFLSIDEFADAQLVRGNVRDLSAYEKVLQVIEGSDGPQFVFCITMAIHSGYDDDVEAEFLEELTEGEDPALVEGLSQEQRVYSHLIRLADADLGQFVDQLDALSRPVALCFFGDHQPTVSEGLFAQATGETLDDARKQGDLARLASAYEVPYFVWQNAAMREGAGAAGGASGGETTGDAPAADEPTSLCYLQAQTLRAAGLPLSPFQELLLQTRTEYPLLNSFGFEKDGSWQQWGPADAEPRALNDYAVATYYQLYGQED